MEGTGPEDPSPTQDSTPVTEPDETPTPEVAEAVDRSPLETGLGISNDPEELSQQYGAAYLAFEEFVEECMTPQGFEYFPLSPTTPAPEEFVLTNGVTDSDLLNEYGYGVSRSLRLQLDNLDQYRGDTELDANGMYIESLSAEGREAYLDAYSACLRDANDTLSLPDDIPEFLQTEIEELNDRIDNDPAVVAAWTEWSTCLATEGITAERREDIAQRLNDEAATIQPAIEQAITNALDQDLPTVDLDVSAAEALSALDTLERDLAEVDVLCAQSVDLDGRLQEIRYSLEQEFVDDNADRLATSPASDD